MNLKIQNPKYLANGLNVRTHTCAGNIRTDMCYFLRNMRSLECNSVGWPQNDPVHPECAGKNNEIDLKECLHNAGEPDWWKSFEGCTSADQCWQTRPQRTSVK